MPFLRFMFLGLLGFSPAIDIAQGGDAAELLRAVNGAPVLEAARSVPGSLWAVDLVNEINVFTGVFMPRIAPYFEDGWKSANAFVARWGAFVRARGFPVTASIGWGGASGDVLAGLIGGLVAQFARHPAMPGVAAGPGQLSLFDTARLGVQAHAVAGELWAKSHHAGAGLLASELADLLPAVLEELREK